MRKTLLVFSLLVAPTILAQTADLHITSFVVGGAATTTNERITLQADWKNEGPGVATFVNVTVTGSPTPFFILSNATTGWPCYANPEGDTFRCQQAAVAPGQQAELVLQMLSPATPGPFELRIAISASETDPDLSDNAVVIPMSLNSRPSTDLSISPQNQLHRVQSGDSVSIPLIVANSGTQQITSLTAFFTLPVLETIPPLSASGAGWSCGGLAFGPQAVICTRTALAPGEVAPITLTTVAPADGETFTVNARVGGQGFSDPLMANNVGAAVVTTAVEVESWSRVLLPLVGPDVHGANGALWRTETTLLLDTAIFVEPLHCELVITCLQFPVGAPFAYTGVAGALGQFLHMRSADKAKLHVNTRVYDVSRSTETAGAEIPIVREEDFTSGPISLLGIPVAPHYRHTLRVYDFDGRNGAPVSIRIYSGSETTPRLSLTRTLSAPGVTVGDHRPLHPGTIQFEIGQLLPLAGIETLRVDVEPLESGLRLWSFVSVTNNETHHVTTFSAQ
ncbi:MAG TPA: hypothetical protein VEK79_18040 [Thermoanaerobaculia bacterium]|nr:hypothetical protein [Thermoanaerobaculia bacterium]